MPNELLGILISPQPVASWEAELSLFHDNLELLLSTFPFPAVATRADGTTVIANNCQTTLSFALNADGHPLVACSTHIQQLLRTVFERTALRSYRAENSVLTFDLLYSASIVFSTVSLAIPSALSVTVWWRMREPKLNTQTLQNNC